MNTALKHWKEAATLILVAGHKLGANSLSSRTPPAASSGSPQGSSGGRPHLPHKSCFNYDVLLLKRSGKSGFMPNAYVFPGGRLDSSDFSTEWLDIFKSFSDSPGFGLRGVKQPMKTRPPIFATDRLKLGSPVPGEVALRICALRETFEESGVLLVVSKTEAKSLPKSLEHMCADHQHHKVSELCSTELSRWRALVNQNPSNFIRMCRELEVLPNIWALHEWGNWLTPKSQYGATRFDTAFFICCLQEVPHTLQDEKEIVRFQWSTPSQVLQMYQAQELWIPLPQFYELRRLCRFPELNDLNNFARQRATEGCEQWLPVVVFQDEQTISLLPGDKLYPLDTSGEAEADESTDPQLQDPQSHCALHRMVVLDPYTVNLQITITPKYNHVLPVREPALSHDLKSQL